MLTLTEAAQSMRKTAEKLEAWARACESAQLPDAELFRKALEREARRVRDVADGIEAPAGRSAA